MRTKSLLAMAALVLLSSACSQRMAPEANSLTGRAGVQGARATVAEPAVTTILSPHWDSRGDSKINTIVLHHTAMVQNAAYVAKFFQNPTAKVSSHYIVDRDGTIVRAVPDDKRSWHAGRSQFNGVGDVNAFSIGIEICNVGDNVEPYPEAQMKAIVQLVAWLAKTYEVPLTNITRHRDVAVPAGRKTDTSNNFDAAYVSKGVQAILDGRKLPRFSFKAAPAGYDPRQQSYTVKPGDTWESIGEHVYDAESLGQHIANMNPGKRLVSGTQLRMPTSYPND